MAFFLWSSASGWGLISMAIWCSLSGVLSFTDLSSRKPLTFLTQHLLPKELELTELPICCYKPWENAPFRSPAMSGILNWHLSYSALGPPLHLSYGHVPAGCSQMVLSRGRGSYFWRVTGLGLPSSLAKPSSNCAESEILPTWSYSHVPSPSQVLETSLGSSPLSFTNVFPIHLCCFLEKLNQHKWYQEHGCQISKLKYRLCCFLSLSCVWLFMTPWTATYHASLSFTISQSFLKFMSIESVMPSNHLILCRLLLLLPSIFPSIRVFPNKSALCIRLAKVLELQLQHQSFQWIFRVDFL